jgi:hypothetical protein
VLSEGKNGKLTYVWKVTYPRETMNRSQKKSQRKIVEKNDKESTRILKFTECFTSLTLR